MLNRFQFTLALMLCLTASLQAAPILKWDKTEVEISMEPDQEEARATFTVTNEGSETVRISKIKTSCGCTGSIVDRKIIKPGESTEIVGTFNRGKRKGLNRNRLEVFIDGQESPVATLLIAVQIPVLIEAMPQIVYWSRSGSKTPRQVRLNLDERYIDEITQIEYDRSKLTVVEKEEATKKADLILEINPLSYTEASRSTVTVYGAGSGGRKAEARVHVIVQP